MEGQQQQISPEAIDAMCSELGKKTLLLAEANVRLAHLARRIAELEAPAPVATLEGARERRTMADELKSAIRREDILSGVQTRAQEGEAQHA